ncbi:MAG TPA: hypothetical protein VGA93_08140, partial [Actinomycetota bacterium]
GKVRVRLGLAAEGSPILRLLNREGELRAIMGLTSDGTPVIQFMDKKGEPMWMAPEKLPEEFAVEGEPMAEPAPDPGEA